MDIDGRNQTQLTPGRHDVDLVVTADGQWVVYSSLRNGRRTLWRIPLAGGTPTPVTDFPSVRPAISPDGRLVACRYFDDPNTHGKLAVLRFPEGEVVKLFDLPPEIAAGAQFRWTPDGRGITYVKTLGGVSNIWSQPLDGGQTQQLTRFESDRIGLYDWSRDGRHLVFARGVLNNDVVLVHYPMGRQ